MNCKYAIRTCDISLKAKDGFQPTPENNEIYVSRWRRGSESNDVFTDYQPQYPGLQGYFNADFKGLQELSDTIRPLPDLTRHLHANYSVIEEIVEGFVEGVA